jgi:hypothetical protein
MKRITGGAKNSQAASSRFRFPENYTARRGNMRPSEKSEANSSITPHERIKNIEVHCWKIHAEAFVGAAGLGFSVPAGAADGLIWKDMGSLDRKQNAAS